ncbi:ribosomal protein DAP3 [Ophiocordyceps camponoti-floridani]|uniref:Small ribosomal subunit protein mS29 n=1 Tax=Ophiocordyceps camponoti-floridani TaxID=2030778 RepID=A0A8H4Q0U5_9HYPO|nr:ribosomal protein DAP3 [Ophiocordyceps camponoti-floridani]
MAPAGLLFRSFTRPSTASATAGLRTTSASFSTTTALLANLPAAVAAARAGIRTKQKTNFKKKRIGDDKSSVKKPAPGERKAFRLRIQTSNNNAILVQGLDELSKDSLADDASAGRMFSIPDSVVDQLRLLRAFKTTQSWGMFRKPHVLVRSTTVDLAKRMDAACQKGEKPLRCVITGPRWAGKSLLLMQAMMHALLRGWIVVHIPECMELTNGNTDYSPIPGTKPLRFIQPQYTLRLIEEILNVNEPVLRRLSMQKDWPALGPFDKDATLDHLFLNLRESEYAWPAFEAFWDELQQPGRPPILLFADGLTHFNVPSDYRDPTFKPVHAHQLALPKVFIDALAGRTEFLNGGAAIAAISTSKTTVNISQDLALAQAEAAQNGTEIPLRNAWERKYDELVFEALKSVSIVRVPNVSKDEGRALLEYWAASGLFKETVDARSVTEKWTLGGHGVLGEMEKVALLSLRP